MTDSHQPLTAAWSSAVLASAGLGFAVAAYLTRLHLDLFYGTGVASALCDLGGTFDCSAVNASAESEIFGFPQALLALPVYLVAAGLALAARRRHDPAYALTLAGLGGLAVAYSAWLAWVSATVIGAWCLFCIALYVVNASLFGLGLWGARHMGVRRTLAVGSAVKTISGSVVSGTVAFGVLWSAYDYVRDGMADEAAAVAVAAPAPVLAKGAATGGETKKVRLAAARTTIAPPPNAPSRGPADAKVTIVELSDFQCPFCKRLAASLHQLTVEYPQDVRLVYVDYPLNLDCTKAKLDKSMHPSACDAAAAGVCADVQGHFWEMHDRLWEHQGELNPKTYRSIAEEIGLDLGVFQACLQAPATKERIVAGTTLGADLGVDGTPTFYVNGRQMAGGQPIEVLRAVVEAELAGNKDMLDLEVAVDTETTGAVTGAATVPVAGTTTTIDAFEASLAGSSAVSRPGVEPARGLSWYDASAACEAAGKRLCTEREWLAACTGAVPVDADGNGVASDDTIAGRRYGYGDARLSGVCADSRNPDAIGELLTGNHPRCGTPEGVYDLVGGVKEWIGLTPSTAAVKGGSYSSRESARCGYFRDDIAPDTKEASTGFRCCSGAPDPAPPAVVPGRDVGESLATFSLPLLDGATFSSASLAGKPSIVTFWASWCGPCQKEMPALAKVYQTHKKDGLQILGISVDTDDQKLRTWLGAHPMPFLIARDPGGVEMKAFPNRGLPTTLWIRRDGTIRLRTTGVPPGGEKRIEELVAELVAG